MFSIGTNNADLQPLISLKRMLPLEGFGEVSSFMNSIFSVTGDIETLFNGDESQKANAIKGLINKSLKMIEKVISKEVDKAKKDVKTQTQKSEDLLNKAKKAGVQLEGEFDEIAASIDTQTDIVTEATAQIKEVEEAIKERQEEAEAIIKEIEDKQKALREADNTKEQAKILAQMHGLTSSLNGIGAIIAEHNKTLQTLIQTVEATAQNIETATNNMAVVQENGEAQIEQLTQDTAGVAQEVIQTGAEGQGNNQAAVVLEESAAAAGSNAVTGSTIAPKLMSAAADQEAAGAIRLGSLKTNINKVATTISAIGNNSEIVTSFKNSIGASLGKYADLVVGWNSTITPILTSVGSFESMSGGANELITAIGSDMQTIGYKLNDRGRVRLVQQESNAGEVSGEELEVSQERGEEPSTVTGASLQSANFEISKLRTFGV